MSDPIITPTPAVPSQPAASGPQPVTLATRVMEWSRPVIAAFSLGIFALAFFVSWQRSDAATLNILVGAIVSLVSSVAGYYFGSSAGSQKKDDVIHAALVTAQATTGT
jgi:hypothetical protein